jgi:hypothetical protein
LVTTGLVDELPEVPGVAERWGRDVLHCPYCHGWEVRDRCIGVLATGPMGPQQAHLWRQWSPHVLLLLHDAAAPDAEEAERLAARGIAVVDGPVAGLVVAGDTLTGVRLASGEVVALDAVVVAPRFTARASVLASLGLKPVNVEMSRHVVGSQIPADTTGATAVPGVWVAGNVADVRAQVILAAAAGLNAAAAAINADLVAEDTRTAVDAYRHQIDTMFEQDAWEQRYRAKPTIWSGRPNPQLVAEATALTPGRALDVGLWRGRRRHLAGPAGLAGHRGRHCHHRAAAGRRARRSRRSADPHPHPLDPRGPPPAAAHRGRIRPGVLPVHAPTGRHAARPVRTTGRRGRPRRHPCSSSGTTRPTCTPRPTGCTFRT